MNKDLDNHGNDPVEHLLNRFRPKGPPAVMRQRVLSGAAAVGTNTRPHRTAVALWRSAVAAGLLLALLLNLQAERISTGIADRTGIGPAVWTQDEEQVASVLNGEGWGRRYLATALRAGPLGRTRGIVPPAQVDGWN